jgi:PAS domain S-box-containing protein
VVDFTNSSALTTLDAVGLGWFGRRGGLALALAAAVAVLTALPQEGPWHGLIAPAGGLALGALVLAGVGLWPGLLLGGFAARWMTDDPATAAGEAVAQTLAVVLAAKLLARLGFSPALQRLRDVGALVAGAALAALGGWSTGEIGESLLAGWPGHMLAVLVVAPLLFAWATRAEGAGTLPAPAAHSGPGRHRSFSEAVFAWAALLVLGLFVFAPTAVPGGVRQPFLLFAPLAWLALRFGPRTSSAGIFLTALLAVAASLAGWGPFAGGAHNADARLGLQIFVAVQAITTLALAAAVREHAGAAREGQSVPHALLEGTPAPVDAKDSSGGCLPINPAAAQVFARAPDESLGQDDLPLGRAPRRTAEFGPGDPAGEAAEEAVTLTGHRHTVLWNGSPVRAADGEGLGPVGVARDIAERKQTERALQAAVRARDEFLYIAGHELRTPLCTVVLELGSLERHCRKSGVDERIITRVSKILTQTDRLTQLMHRLLEVSRLSSTTLDLRCERVDLAELTRDMLERFAESASRAGSTLELRAPLAALGIWDKLRLEQLLTNLLGNAIKYGAGKPIVVSIESTPLGSSLSVQDGGIGVAREDVERIFEAFERGVSVDHFAGFGLGLYISRRIVEAHGGTISVSSTPGQGATFLITLPRSARPPSSGTSGAAPVNLHGASEPTRAPELRVGVRG